MVSNAELLNRAMQQHTTGNLAEAEQLYRQILKVDPADANALHLLGVVAGQGGQFQQAVELIRQALAILPHAAEFQANLGRAYRELGNLEEALAAYHTAVRLRPDLPELHTCLGDVLARLGKKEEADACYQRAEALRPTLDRFFAEQSQADQPSPARPPRPTSAGPQQDTIADTLNNMGLAAKEQGQFAQAIGYYRQALAANPRLHFIHSNLGAALYEHGDRTEAVACYENALQLKPDDPETYYDLAIVLKATGRLTEATACYQKALQLKPDFAEAYLNLADALKDQGRLNEVIGCYRKAAEVRPGYAAAHSNLLYTLLFSPDYDAAAIYEEHRRWNESHAAPLARSIRPHDNDPSPGRRLRVGYVSANFCNHCQTFFTSPLLAAHDHEHFEIFAYSAVSRPDAFMGRLRGLVDFWRDIGHMSDEELAEAIRADRIDVLVDLTMHMGPRNFVFTFARKPAPVQVCWLAYPGTTGLTTMDYRLTDPYLDPPGLLDAFCSEKSVRLPETFWCYDPLTEEPTVNELPAKKSGVFTFGSLNNFCKINEQCLALWAQVLREAPASRLLLLAPPGPARDQVLARLQQDGIAAARVEFVDRRPRLEYLQVFHQIDCCLDPFPCNGHSTTLDALWMGVPTVTLVGKTAVGRGAWSLLNNVGFQALAAQTPERYVRNAVALANDPSRLGRLRATLRQRLQKSPLMDAPRFARNVEAAYRAMWQRWCG